MSGKRFRRLAEPVNKQELFMNRDYIPQKDEDLRRWTVNYAAQMAAMGLTVGITPQQVSDYQVLSDAFLAALTTATDPSTRTRGTISAKEASKKLLKDEARELARIINAFPATTNQQRIDLGLNPRTGQITPSKPPTEPPVMEIVEARGRLMRIRLHAQDSTRRGKPAGVAGASLFSFVGSAPPADITQWTFEGSTTRTSFDLQFPPTVAAGAQVFLTSFWFSARSQSGPACQPVSAYIAGGVVAASDAG
jgi:hypothetical protein